VTDARGLRCPSLGDALFRLPLRQFGVYLVAGGGAAAANFAAGASIRLVSTSAVVYGVSVVVGMAVGTVTSFFLHRRFTFLVHDEPAAPQAVRFAMVAAGGVVIALTFAEGVLALWQLAGSPWLSRGVVEALAHAVTIGVNTVYGFVAMKFFALKRRGTRAQKE
jgi:putative flippase GtrA